MPRIQLKLDSLLQVQVTHEMLRAIEEEAEREHKSRSEMAREIIRFYFRHRESGPLNENGLVSSDDIS